MPFVNKVKTTAACGVFSLPINLLAITQFFEKKMSPAEAQEFVAKLGDRGIGVT